MSSILKEVNPHVLLSSFQPPVWVAVPKSMQAIVVDSQPVVNEQPAPIIGSQAKAIDTTLLDNQETCPTHCVTFILFKAGPPSAGIPIVHIVHHSHHLCVASTNIEASDFMTKIEHLLLDTFA
jgi:hypothetical protein